MAERQEGIQNISWALGYVSKYFQAQPEIHVSSLDEFLLFCSSDQSKLLEKQHLLCFAQVIYVSDALSYVGFSGICGCHCWGRVFGGEPMASGLCFCVLDRVKGVGGENSKFGRGFLVVFGLGSADLASPCRLGVLFQI